MTDRAWCPSCERLRHQFEHSDNPDECRNCESELVEEWPLRVRVIEGVKRVLTVALGVAMFGGPPVYVVYRVLQGGPLYAKETVTRTVTETNHTGILVDVIPALSFWVLLFIILWAAAIMPRQ